MNGIVPPSPMYIAGFPKWRCDAASSACSSHGASSGASQPLLAVELSNRTRAPNGGSFSSVCFTASVAACGSTRGGIRIDSFTRVYGRSTLPAFEIGGHPSAPVIARPGRHVRFRISSALSVDIASTPGWIGNF
jgi:hypothetical protein